jgi:hypothetical protein
VKLPRARTLASAGTVGAGVVTGAAAFLIVRGLPGVLYAAGICLAAIVGAVALRPGKTLSGPGLEAEAVTLRQPRRRRESRIAVVPQPAAEPARAPEPAPITDPEALASGSELEEHRAALANLGAQLARESAAASRDMQRLEKRIRELEMERDDLLALVAQERARFEHTIDAICDELGHDLAEIEPPREALISG